MVCVGLPPDTSVVAGATPLQMALNRLNIVGSVTGTLKVSASVINLMFQAHKFHRMSKSAWTSPHEVSFIPYSAKGRCMMSISSVSLCLRAS